MALIRERGSHYATPRGHSARRRNVLDLGPLDNNERADIRGRLIYLLPLFAAFARLAGDKEHRQNAEQSQAKDERQVAGGEVRAGRLHEHRL